MGVRRLIANLAYGVRHLLWGDFWTPRQHRGKLKRWSENEPTVTETDVSAVLDNWGEQQSVAWILARILAWSTLIRVVRAITKARTQQR